MTKLTVDQMLLRAKAHERKGEMGEAYQLYQAVLQAYPGNKHARQALSRQDWPGQAGDSGPGPAQETIDHLLALYHQGQFAVAAGLAGKLVQDFPNSFVLWNLLGISGAQGGQIAIAERAFRRATELNPDSPDVFSNLGNILKGQGRLEEAIASYTRALALKPDFAGAHNNLGNALKDQGRLDEAVASYRRAIEHKPDFVDAYCNLFELFEKSNQLSLAREVIENSQRIFPTLPDELRICRGVYHFRMKEFDAVIAELRGMEARGLRDNLELRRLELLSKSFEKVRNYGDAFLHMRMMNAIIRAAFRKFDEPATRYLDQIEKRRLNLESAREQRPAGTSRSGRAAPVFLVGFPRSGTTLLDTFLRGHPQVEVVEEKPMLARAINRIGDFRELEQIEGLDDAELSQMRELYFDEMKKHIESGGKKIIVDKFPLNLVYAPEMHALFPDAKYILALRHPLDCLLSNYKQNFRLNAPMYLMSDLSRAAALYDGAMSIFRLSKERYALDVHSVRYEDLTRDTAGVLRSLVAFLGIEWDANVLDHKRTAGQRRMIDTPSYSQVVEDVYKDSSNLWMKYEEYLRPHIPGLQYWIDVFGYA